MRLLLCHALQQAVASEEKMEILNGPESALTFDSFSSKYFSVCKIFFNAFSFDSVSESLTNHPPYFLTKNGAFFTICYAAKRECFLLIYTENILFPLKKPPIL